MSKHHFSAKSASICGHVEMTSFAYGSKSTRMSDQLYAANTICMACSSKLGALVAPEEKGFFKLQLPSLIGTVRTIPYANGLRIKRLRAIGPVMARLDKSDEPLAKVVLAVYQLLFKVTEAAFWITTKDLPFDRFWMAFEVAALMRRSVTSSVRTSASSVHEYWRIRDSSVLATAAESLGALHIETALPPQETTIANEAVA